MLVVFAGLPGTGKSTIARALAQRQAATLLRIDVIEQAIRATGARVGVAGYAVGNALATANLAIGQTVIADSVNPVPDSRAGWHHAALAANAPYMDVEIVCSDTVEHRRRVEQRTSDIDGLVLPDWDAVLGRYYEPWDEPHLVIDTALVPPDEAVALIESAMAAIAAPRSGN